MTTVLGVLLCTTVFIAGCWAGAFVMMKIDHSLEDNNNKNNKQ